MANVARIPVGVHCQLRASLAALCLLATLPAAWAGDLILREQDVDERAVTNALVPHDVPEGTETLGIRFRDTPAATDAGGAGGISSMAPASSTASASLSLLITFNSNSSKLTRPARAALDKVARGLQSTRLSPYRFRVEGHADPRGSAAVNLKLSESRAEAVVAYLTAEGGIAADRITAVGKGSSEPVNLENPAAPENRRVTILTVRP